MLLADLFTLDLNIGSGFLTVAVDIGKSRALADFLSITISVATYRITYNLIDFLVILGISVIATVLVEKLARQTTPGGFLGGFLIALIGIWIFITFIPLTWNQDFNIPGTHVPVITSFIGAVFSILMAHLLKKGLQQEAKASKGIKRIIILSLTALKSQKLLALESGQWWSILQIDQSDDDEAATSSRKLSL